MKLYIVSNQSINHCPQGTWNLTGKLRSLHISIVSAIDHQSNSHFHLHEYYSLLRWSCSCSSGRRHRFGHLLKRPSRILRLLLHLLLPFCGHRSFWIQVISNAKFPTQRQDYPRRHFSSPAGRKIVRCQLGLVSAERHVADITQQSARKKRHLIRMNR